MTTCPCLPQGDRERWHRSHGTPPCEGAREQRRQLQDGMDRQRRRRLALAAATAPPATGRRPWVPGTAILTDEVEAL